MINMLVNAIKLCFYLIKRKYYASKRYSTCIIKLYKNKKIK